MLPPQRLSWNSTSRCALSRVCSLISWMASLLSSSLSTMCARMSDFHDRNMSSACQLNTYLLAYWSWVHASCGTPWMPAQQQQLIPQPLLWPHFLESLVRGAMGPTSNVQLLGTVPATWYIVEVYFSACGIVEISDNLGAMTGYVWVDLPPPDFTSGLSSGLLSLSSNLTCLWNEKAWSWLSYCAAPLLRLIVPGSILNTSWHKPDLLWDGTTEGMVAWPANECSNALTSDPATSGLIVDVLYPSVASCFAWNLTGVGTATHGFINGLLNLSFPLTFQSYQFLLSNWRLDFHSSKSFGCLLN